MNLICYGTDCKDSCKIIKQQMLVISLNKPNSTHDGLRSISIIKKNNAKENKSNNIKVNNHMVTNDWQASLIVQGANFINNIIVDFGNASEELANVSKQNTLCDLSHLALLAVEGEDAVSFLQGQVTNDVKLLEGSNAHLTAHCNPKGRVLALFLAFSLNGTINLQFNKILLAPILKRLKMYVMRSKVDINDLSESILKFGINGADAEQILSPLFSSLPTKNYALVSLDNVAIIKLPSINGHTRFEILSDAETAPALWNAIKEKCQLVGKPCWDWLDIQSGIPDVTQNTQEKFVPQMLNLDLINGINFKKGCYTGQEIIARTHYLGSVKRRTYLASIASNTSPETGDKLLDNKQNDIGQIVRVAANANNGFDVLAEMRIEAKNSGDIFWQTSALSFQSLPYSLEVES